MEINIYILQPTPLSPGAVYLRWSDPEMTVNKRKKPTINVTAITMVNSGKDIQSKCHLSKPN